MNHLEHFTIRLVKDSFPTWCINSLLTYTNMKKTIGIIFISFLLSSQLLAQNTIEDITFNGQAWKVSAAEYSIETYKGKEALALKNGAAILEGAELKNGIIEFDIAFAEKRQFSGIMFRMFVKSWSLSILAEASTLPGSASRLSSFSTTPGSFRSGT